MKISVALCTYNGERFLKEQLNSIASQIRQPDELIVCDDGSSDDTLVILERFASEAAFPVHIVRNACRLGVSANFQQAVRRCTGELTALSDQDDVWLPDKLHTAELAFLTSAHPEKLLFCTCLQYVDSDLKPLGFSAIPNRTDFANAVAENIATGCTVVFGSEIMKLFLHADAGSMVMHDWWLYLLAAAFGEIEYDAKSSVLYRQHGNNVAGWKPRPSKLLHRTLSLGQRLRDGQTGMDSLNQADRFIKAYPHLAPNKHDIVCKLIQLRKTGLFSRLRYLTHPKIMRNDFFENLGLKIVIFMGWH